MMKATRTLQATSNAFYAGAVLLSLLLVVLLSSCAGVAPTATIAPTATTAAEPTFDKAQLAVFDGTGGNPAYVAVKGIVYDVSDVPEWSGGKHNGFAAGKDLTSVFPHAASRFDGVPVVGTYVG